MFYMCCVCQHIVKLWTIWLALRLWHKLISYRKISQLVAGAGLKAWRLDSKWNGSHQLCICYIIVQVIPLCYIWAGLRFICVASYRYVTMNRFFNLNLRQTASYQRVYSSIALSLYCCGDTGIIRAENQWRTKRTNSHNIPQSFQRLCCAAEWNIGENTLTRKTMGSPASHNVIIIPNREI